MKKPEPIYFCEVCGQPFESYINDEGNLETMYCDEVCAKQAAENERVNQQDTILEDRRLFEGV